MKTHIVEVTNGPNNWGKFLLGVFDTEHEYRSVVSGGKLLDDIAGRSRTRDEIRAGAPRPTWDRRTFLVLDLQTGEGCLIAPYRSASVAADVRRDLDRHKIWICPLGEPFLCYLYERGDADPLTVPAHVDLPDAVFAFTGHRRPGTP